MSSITRVTLPKTRFGDTRHENRKGMSVLANVKVIKSSFLLRCERDNCELDFQVAVVDLEVDILPHAPPPWV